MRARIGRHWFLATLAAVLVVGAVWHEPLRPLTERIPRDPLVTAILLLMSLPIDLRRSLAGGSAKSAAAIAIAVNALAAGPLAALARPLLSDALADGLVIAALAPCTVASAAVWTRRGGGNEAVALATTVATSLLSFLTLPLGVALLVGEEADFDALSLAVRLLLIVVAPMMLGQALRAVPSLRRACDRQRHGLALAAQGGLLSMVLIGAVRSGEMLARPNTSVGVADWLSLAVAAALVHVALFALAWRCARAASCEPADALAAGVAGSQKTLAVGLGVAIGFGPLAIVPMIVYHALQLLIDAVLVDRLRVEESSADPFADAQG